MMPSCASCTESENDDEEFGRTNLAESDFSPELESILALPIEVEPAQDDAGQSSPENSVTIYFANRNGVKYVPVKVNGVGFDMILDTGCSGTLISIAEANYLYQKGLLTIEDVAGTEVMRIADGSLTENMVVNLRYVILSDKILLKDVRATIAENPGAPLLLGNEVLDRFQYVRINNEDQSIEIGVGAPQSGSDDPM